MTIKHFGFVLPLALGIASVSMVHATEPSTFLIAAASGYGIEDCLGEGGECGQVVADAWCEAHGRGAASKFGRSNGDASAMSNAAPPNPQPYFITCGN
jgi:hypothetical protein